MGLAFLIVLVIAIGLSLLATGDGNIQTVLINLVGFLESTVIPFLLGIAFLIFVINAIRFFVISGDSSESQENAKSLALYSIGAFVFLLSFWGLVNIFAGGVGLDGCNNNLIPDYVNPDFVNTNPCTPNDATESASDSPLPAIPPSSGFGLDPIPNTPVVGPQ